MGYGNKQIFRNKGRGFSIRSVNNVFGAWRINIFCVKYFVKRHWGQVIYGVLNFAAKYKKRAPKFRRALK